MSSAAKPPVNWAFFFRVIAKAAVLFALCNLIFAVLQPLEALGKISLYNTVLPGRERLPYGENPDQSYNLSLNNIPAMLASHIVSRPKASDEFRVFIIGDSGIWGWFLPNKDTLAAHINAAQNETPHGRRVMAYNLGYPVLALLKDLMILNAAMPFQPDLIIWPVTLDSFPIEKQLSPVLLQNNPTRVHQLIARYQLNIDPNDSRFVQTDFWGNTIIGQRRGLADWLRLQLYAFSWAATGIDQYIPADIPLRKSDFDTDISWQSFKAPTPLSETNLALDVLKAGVKLADSIPILIVNEPIYISTRQNSDLRYNAWYPRWAYDAYRDLLGKTASSENWQYLDLWDSIAPDEFTDSPVHLTPAGEQQLAEQISGAMLKIMNGGTPITNG
jgi:lysophospholipase L1-like esterase